MDLSIDDLAITYKETFTARSSWYNLGLALQVPVASLDGQSTNSGITLQRVHTPLHTSLSHLFSYTLDTAVHRARAVCAVLINYLSPLTLRQKCQIQRLLMHRVNEHHQPWSCSEPLLVKQICPDVWLFVCHSFQFRRRHTLHSAEKPFSARALNT